MSPFESFKNMKINNAIRKQSIRRRKAEKMLSKKRLANLQSKIEDPTQEEDVASALVNEEFVIHHNYQIA